MPKHSKRTLCRGTACSKCPKIRHTKINSVDTWVVFIEFLDYVNNDSVVIY